MVRRVSDRRAQRLRGLEGPGLAALAWRTMFACTMLAAGPASATLPVWPTPAARVAEPNARPVRPPWLRRHLPTRHRLEPGVFVGVFAPHARHELYDRHQPWLPYAKAAPTLGLRLAYYPLRPLGLEIEGALTPTAIDSVYGGRALLYAGRAHLIAQLPLASIVPFVLLGGGLLGARSDLLGNDVDLTSHFGGGLKIYAHRYLGVRLDVRGTVGSGHLTGGSRVVYPEATLGLVVPLGLQARDSDGDGLYDPGQKARPVDACPEQPGARRHTGCPDRDGDEIVDRDDRCPVEPGLPARRGCPALRDRDNDGVFDPGQADIPPPGGDLCPDVVGRTDQIGCPAPDTDGDGLVDPDDRCPREPEVFNGYEDTDGCPDVVPVDVVALVGTLRGINFAFMSAAITPDSRPALDQAVAVMRDNPTIRLEIQGHTDNDGKPELNLDISRRRAEAVRAYMITAGVDGERLRAIGYGGDRPIADNAIEAGKAQNRRIELRLLDASDKVVSP
jgi:OOP family OmpA-OmpF porin